MRRLSCFALLALMLVLPGWATAATGVVQVDDYDSGPWQQVPLGLHKARAIAADGRTSGALASDGSLVVWGYYPPLPSSDVVGATALAIGNGGNGVVMLLSDGTVQSWSGSAVTPPAGLAQVVHIATDGQAFAAIRVDGRLVAWGSGPAAAAPSIPNAVSVAMRSGQAIAVLSDGTAVSWGTAVVPLPGGLTGLAEIRLGVGHALARHLDGTVTAWGDNSRGQCTVPVGLAGVSAVIGGNGFSAALRGDGTVAVWGAIAAPPAEVTDVVQLSAGDRHALALRADGEVVAWGECTSHGLTEPPAGLPPVAHVAVATGHVVALLTDGTVRAWGDDAAGQCDVPAGLSNVVAVAAGWQHSLALRNDGSIVGWGSGAAATPPSLALAATAIAAAGNHSLALYADGSVKAWGDNSKGQSAVPASVTAATATAIDASEFDSMAMVGGKPVVWGDNTWAQCYAPSIAMISAHLGTHGGYYIDTAHQIGGWGSLSYLVDNSWKTTAHPELQSVIEYDWLPYGLDSSGVITDLLLPSGFGAVRVYQHVTEQVSRDLSLALVVDNSSPHDLVVSTLTVPEDTPVGTPVCTLSATDDDGDPVYAYMTEEAASPVFGINYQDMHVRVTGSLDQLARRCHPLQLFVYDNASMPLRAVIVITVTPVDHAPTALTLAPATVTERRAPGSLVGALTTSDPDAGDTFSYALVSGAGADSNADFAISGSRLVTSVALAADSGPYSVRVRATDSGGKTIEQAFAITVTADPAAQPPASGASGGAPANGRNCGVGGLAALLALPLLARRRRR